MFDRTLAPLLSDESFSATVRASKNVEGGSFQHLNRRDLNQTEPFDQVLPHTRFSSLSGGTGYSSLHL